MRVYIHPTAIDTVATPYITSSAISLLVIAICILN